MSLLSWRDARDVVSRFFTGVDETLDPIALGTALEGAPGVVDAAIAMFRHAFTTVASSDFNPQAKDNEQWMTLAGYAVAYAPSGGRRLLDEVVFDVRSPTLYGVLAPYLHAAVPVADLAHAIVTRLRGDDELPAANALALPYYVFGRPSDPRLPQTSRDAITAAVASLRARPGAGPLITDRLRDYETPLDAI